MLFLRILTWTSQILHNSLSLSLSLYLFTYILDQTFVIAFNMNIKDCKRLSGHHYAFITLYNIRLYLNTTIPMQFIELEIRNIIQFTYLRTHLQIHRPAEESHIYVATAHMQPTIPTVSIIISGFPLRLASWLRSFEGSSVYLIQPRSQLYESAHTANTLFIFVAVSPIWIEIWTVGLHMIPCASCTVMLHELWIGLLFVVVDFYDDLICDG